MRLSDRPDFLLTPFYNSVSGQPLSGLSNLPKAGGFRPVIVFEVSCRLLLTSMNIKKLLTWITPLILGALLGLYEILHGLFYVRYGTPDQKRDYPLEIVLGLLIMSVCLVGHWVIRRISHANTRTIWITESILIGFIIYGFYRS